MPDLKTKKRKSGVTAVKLTAMKTIARLIKYCMA